MMLKVVAGVRAIETEVKQRVPEWGGEGVGVHECRFGVGDGKVIEIMVRTA